MSTLNEYLGQKRQAILQRRETQDESLKNGEAVPTLLKANTSVEGRSGIRRIRIRDFQIISDSGPDFAGYNLGPSSPELQLGVLSSCLSHIYLIQAADRQVPLDAVEVEVTAEMHPLAGKPGYEDVPIWPHNLSYTVKVTSSADESTIAALHAAVEQSCPILNLLVNPQQITGKVVLNEKVIEDSKDKVAVSTLNG